MEFILVTAEGTFIFQQGIIMKIPIVFEPVILLVEM